MRTYRFRRHPALDPHPIEEKPRRRLIQSLPFTVRGHELSKLRGRPDFEAH